MTTPQHSTPPTSRRRPRRLPAPVRHAVRDLEAAYDTGTDEQYEAAMNHLLALGAALSNQHREAFNRAMVAAAQRVSDRDFTTRVRAALAAGQTQTISVLPGGVELVQVTGGDLDQLLITLPAPLETDTPEARDLIAEARGALLAGRCPRCAKSVRPAGDQLTLDHETRCALSPARLERARRA